MAALESPSGVPDLEDSSPTPTLPRKRGRERWARARYPAAVADVVDVVFVCVLVAVAYGFALTGLLRGAFLLSPTAYVGLVPFVAVGLMIARAPAPHREPAIRDRYVDYAIGLPLLACALLLLLLFPAHASPLFWQQRLDLLSLPLFAAGAAATIFGIRALWRVRWGIAFLFLGLLVPLTPSIETLLGPMGGATSNGVLIGSKAALGSLIVGLALMNLAYGRFLWKVLWVGAGVGLAWALAAAGNWVLIVDRPGADATLHRGVELAMLLLSVFVMIGTLPLFRLGFAAAPTLPSPASGRGKSPALRPYTALSIVAVAAVLAFIGESSLPTYSAVLTETGAPRLNADRLGQVAISGLSLHQIGSLAWVGRYYGPTATGERYGLDCACANPGSSSASPPVIVDDIVTVQDLPLSVPQLALIEPVRAARLINLARVDLGNGVIGHAAIYRQSSGPDWIAVYWDWPVVIAAGTRYEHVVVQASGSLDRALGSSASPAGPVRQAAMRVSDWLDGAPSHPLGDSAARLRADLAGIARTIVKGISAAPSAEAGA